MPPPRLLGVEVGDGGAVLDPAQAGDRPGGEQQRLGERGLARSAVAHEGDVADLLRRERLGRHRHPPGASSLESVESRTSPSLRSPGRLAGAARGTGVGRGPGRTTVCTPTEDPRIDARRTLARRRSSEDSSPSARACTASGSPPTASPSSGSSSPIGTAFADRRRPPRARRDRRDPHRAARHPRRIGRPQQRPRRSRGARSSTRSCDRVADAASSSASPGTSSDEDPRLPVLVLAVLALSMLITYERARAESLGFIARGGLMERAERMVLLGVGLAFDILVPGALADARAHRVHRGPALREGVAPGHARAPAPHAPPPRRRATDEPRAGSAGAVVGGAPSADRAHAARGDRRDVARPAAPDGGARPRRISRVPRRSRGRTPCSRAGRRARWRAASRSSSASAFMPSARARRSSATCGACYGPRVRRRRAATGGRRDLRLVRALLLRAVPPPGHVRSRGSTRTSACIGIEHIAAAIAAGNGAGARAAAPRQLGLRRRVARGPGLHRHRGRRAGRAARAVRVVRRARARRLGMRVDPARRRRPAAEVLAALRANEVVCLLVRPRPHRRRRRGRVLRRAHHAARRARRRSRCASGAPLLPVGLLLPARRPPRDPHPRRRSPPSGRAASATTSPG